MSFILLKKEVNKIRLKYLLFIMFQFFLWTVVLCLAEIFFVILINKFFALKHSFNFYFVFINIILLFALFYNRIGVMLNPEKFATYLEEKFPSLRNEVSSSLSFGKDISYFSKLYSIDLMSALFDNAYKNVLEINTSLLFSLKKIKTLLVIISILCILVFAATISPTPAKVQPDIQPKKEIKKEIISNPKIFDIKLKFLYPSYTGIQPEEKDGTITNYQVIYGTKLNFSLRCTEKITDAYIQTEKDKIGGNINNNAFSSNITLYDSLNFVCKVESGTQTLNTNSFEIEVIKDEYPVVNIVDKEKEILLQDETFIPLKIIASDDFGISKMNLKYYLEKDKKEFKLPLDIIPSRIQDIEIRWNLQNIPYSAGDKIFFWAEVWDNDTISGPKMSQTEKYQILIPLSVNLVENIREKQISFQEKIESVISTQKEITEGIDKLTQKLKRERKFGLEEKKELSRLTQQQQKVEEDMKSLKDDLSSLQDDKSIDIKTLKTIKEINTLLNIMLSDDVKRTLQKLQEAIDKMTLSDIEKNLYDAKFNQEEFLRKLEQTLSLFKRAFLEHRLSTLSQQIDELKKRQDAISEKLDLLEKKDDLEWVKKGTFSELSYKQRRIKEEMELIEKEIGILSKEFSDVSPVTNKRLKETEKMLDKKNIPSKMKDAYQKLTEFETRSAFLKSKEISDDLSELSFQLKQAQGELLREYREEITQDINVLIKKGLFISQKQEEIIKDVEVLLPFSQMHILSKEKSEIQRLAFQQRRLKNYTDKFIKDIQVAANKTFLVQPHLAMQSNAISSLMKDIQENIDDGNVSSAYQASQRSMLEVNKLVRELLHLEEKARRATASMALEEYMKRLEALAQMQEELNLKTKSCGGGMPMPFDIGSLAYEQQRIRQSLEKLLQDTRGGDLPSQKMLEGVPDEMKDIEMKMIRKEVGKELEKKQEKVLNKLLDAQRSLQIQGQDEGYEREVAKDYKITKPKEIEYVKKKVKFESKFSLDEGGYPLKYKKLIEEYFKIISGIRR